MKFYVPEQSMRRNSSTVLSECRKQLQIFFQGQIIQPDVDREMGSANFLNI